MTFLALVAGCAAPPGAPAAAAAKPAADAATAAAAATPAQRPVLRRTVAHGRWRIEVDSDEGRGPQTLAAEFALERVGARERVHLLSATRVLAGGEPAPIAIDAACRAAWGGDASDTGVLGRFDVAEATLHAVPECVPEPVFGLVTDILALLFVQSEGFSADDLRAAGDTHAFEGFSHAWKRPPAMPGARIDCTGGRLQLESLSPDRAVLVWTPEPMHIAIVRQPRPEAARMMLAGTETIVLEVHCDPRDGALLEAHSRVDRLDLRLWTGFTGESPAAPGELPDGGGIALSIERRIRLERLP